MHRTPRTVYSPPSLHGPRMRSPTPPVHLLLPLPPSSLPLAVWSEAMLERIARVEHLLARSLAAHAGAETRLDEAYERLTRTPPHQIPQDTSACG
jgi:hypothetical protein